MSEDDKSENSNKRIGDLVAVTVVVLTVFLAICKVKDDNIVQAMAKAQSESVDAWAEYQAARLKLHGEENGLANLKLLQSGVAIDKDGAAKQAEKHEREIKKYIARSAETMAKAKRLEAEYVRLNVFDDQFDMSEAFVSIAIAVAAVAALVSAYWLLVVSWVSGAIGVAFGVAGFAGWNFHPDWLAQLLS